MEEDSGTRRPGGRAGEGARGGEPASGRGDERARSLTHSPARLPAGSFLHSPLTHDQPLIDKVVLTTRFVTTDTFHTPSNQVSHVIPFGFPDATILWQSIEQSSNQAIVNPQSAMD